jgi:hypothetical protein
MISAERSSKRHSRTVSTSVDVVYDEKSRRRMGLPTVPAGVRTLIRTMAHANPRWGAPRIHGELLKLGINLCQAGAIVLGFSLETR